MSDAPPIQKLMSYRQAADVLGLSERSVWGLVKSGELPCVRLGKQSVRVDPRDLRAFIDRSKTTKPSNLQGKLRIAGISGA